MESIFNYNTINHINQTNNLKMIAISEINSNFFFQNSDI